MCVRSFVHLCTCIFPFLSVFFRLFCFCSRTALGPTVDRLRGVPLLEGEQVHDRNALEQAGHADAVAAAEDPGAQSGPAAPAGQDPGPQVVPDAVQQQPG